METQKHPCVILCGGQSKRFGSNKLSAHLGGKPILQHVIDRVSPQCKTIALNNLHQDMWLGEGLQNFMDDMPDMGPLSGVLTAMKWAKELGHTRVLTTPADTPFLPPNWARKLSATDPDKIAIPEAEGRHHRVSALWPTDLCEDLQVFLATGNTYKVGMFLDAHKVQYIPFYNAAAPTPFLNINTREDLERAENYLESHTP